MKLDDKDFCTSFELKEAANGAQWSHGEIITNELNSRQYTVIVNLLFPCIFYSAVAISASGRKSGFFGCKR